MQKSTKITYILLFIVTILLGILFYHQSNINKKQTVLENHLSELSSNINKISNNIEKQDLLKFKIGKGKSSLYLDLGGVDDLSLDEIREIRNSLKKSYLPTNGKLIKNQEYEYDDVNSAYEKLLEKEKSQIPLICLNDISSEKHNDIKFHFTTEPLLGLLNQESSKTNENTVISNGVICIPDPELSRSNSFNYIVFYEKYNIEERLEGGGTRGSTDLNYIIDVYNAPNYTRKIHGAINDVFIGYVIAPFMLTDQQELYVTTYGWGGGWTSSNLYRIDIKEPSNSGIEYECGGGIERDPDGRYGLNCIIDENSPL